jgi:lambda repressor-like predicted transcriptional regulator
MLTYLSKKRDGNIHMSNPSALDGLNTEHPQARVRPRRKARQGVTPMQPEPMHPEDIKAALKKKGSSQVKVARTLKLSRSAVAHVIEGRSKSRRIADEISRVTGIPIDELWPGKYDEPSDAT